MIKRMPIISSILMLCVMLSACGGGGGGGVNNDPGPGLMVKTYIAGRVVDDTGKGVSGARIQLVNSGGSAFWSCVTDVEGRFTDEGRLAIDKPVNGTIVATKSGLSPNVLVFSLSPGENHSPVEIVLGTGGNGGVEIGRVRLNGVIRLADGKSAEGAQISINRFTSEGYLSEVFFTRADANGNFADEGMIVISSTLKCFASIFFSEKYYSISVELTISPGGTYDMGMITLTVLP